MDAHGSCRDFNSAFIKLFQHIPPDDYSIFNDPFLDAQGVLKKIKKIQEGELVVVHEFRFHPGNPNKTNIEDLFWLKLIAFPIFDESKNASVYFFIYEDITKRKNTEIELLQTQNIYSCTFKNEAKQGDVWVASPLTHPTLLLHV